MRIKDIPFLPVVFIIILFVPASFLISPGGDSIITREGEPDAPINLEATVGNGIVRLHWDPPLNTGDSALINYHVHKGVTIGSIAKYRTIYAEVPYYNDTSVENTMTYYYYITAENSQGEGTPSNIVEATPVGPPSEPLNFKLFSGDGEAYLSWDIPDTNGGSPILGYKIIRGPNSFSLSQVAELGLVYNHTDTGLKNGAIYYYAVFAFNELGGSAKTEIKSTMPTGPPSTPTNLLAAGSDGSVIVNWTKSADDGGKPILGYHLYRGMTDDNLSMYLDLEPSENCTDENVTNGLTYYYSILSYNMVGPSGLSDIVSALPVGVPGRPVNLTVVPGDRLISLNWEPPVNDGGSPVTEYEVQRITKNDEPFQFNVGTDTEYIDKGLDNGKTYYYSVRAYNDIGAGPFTLQTSMKPESPPPEPRNFYLQEDDGEIRLYWSPPDYISDYPITEFIIYRSVEGGDYSLLINLTSDQFSFIDDDVINGESYGYKIMSLSSIGEGGSTAGISGSPFGMPGLPLNLVATPGNGQVVLMWSEPDHSGGRPLFGYWIYRGMVAGDMNFLVEVDRNMTTYVDADVENGITYNYCILALNTEKEGNRTEAVQAMPIGEPGEPLNLRISELDGVVTLEWDPPVDDCGCPVASYIIYRGLTRETLDEYTTVTNTTFSDHDVESDTTYYYTVSAVNSIGNGSIMEPEVVRIPVEADEDGGIDPTIPIIAGVVLFLIVLIIAILVILMKKKPSDSGEQEEEEEEPEGESMSPEGEKDMMLQRREEMEEMTDVPLTVAQAHSHDHDEHQYTYEDLYGSGDEPQPPEREE